MIPFNLVLSFLLKYRRFIAYGVAALAVGILAWRVTVWRADAQKLDQTVHLLEAERKAHTEDVAKYVKQQADSQQDRLKLAGDLQNLRDYYDEKRAAIQPKTLVVTKEVPGAPCPDTRLSDSFRLQFNSASAIPPTR